MNNAPIGSSHIRVVIVAETGFLTDGYDLFSANFITMRIGLAFIVFALPQYCQTLP